MLFCSDNGGARLKLFYKDVLEKVLESLLEKNIFPLNDFRWLKIMEVSLLIL